MATGHQTDLWSKKLNRFSIAAACLLVAGLTACVAPSAASAATAPQTDVMFVFDTSGSMEPVLEEAKGEIQNVMTQLGGVLPNVDFGLAEARDYGGSAYDPESDDEPWKLDVPVTSNLSAMTDAISGLHAEGGGDAPEAYGRALWETDTNPNVGWRPGARHLIILIADQVPHNANLDEGIPEDFWAEPSPWDTGEELPGGWGIPGTQLKEGETLDFHSVLRQLAADGKPLETVDYHDTSVNYIHYWEYWAALAGGTAVETSEGGQEFAGKLVGLVENAPEDTVCATAAVPTVPSPDPPSVLPVALTPRFGQPGSVVALTPASGKEFCAGQQPYLGGSAVTAFEEFTPSKLTFRVPPAAASELTLSNLFGVQGPQQGYAVDNFRYPWGFNIGNGTGNGAGGTYDANLPITSQDLDSVFTGLGPPGSPQYNEAEEDAKVILKEVGLCYGFGLLSWALYGDAHSQRIPLTYASSSSFKFTPGIEPYSLQESSGGSHALTQALLRGAVSQVSPEAKATWLPVNSAAALASKLNGAFTTGQPALLNINFPFRGGEHGHTLLAYNYESPDPTTGEGIAVDVVDPNIPWATGRPPGDFEMLRVHVKNDGSWTFKATIFGLGDFATQVGNGSGSLEVIPHPRVPGGLELHTTLSGGPSPISVTPPIGDHITAIGYTGAAGKGIPTDVTTEHLAEDGEDSRLLVPASHHQLTISYTSSSDVNLPMRVTGPDFLDSGSLGSGLKTVTVDSKTGRLSTPVAQRGAILSVTSIVGGIQRSATVTFTGKVSKPTLTISDTGQVTLTTSGGNGNAAIALATYNAGGEQAHARPERLTLHGRTRLHRHTPKIKRRKHKRSKRRPRRKK